MTDRLNIEPSADDGTDGGRSVCLALRGELDYGKTTLLNLRLRPVLSAPPEHLVLDVSELTFCDSAGLAVLMSAYQRLGQLGGDLRLRGARASLRRVMRITGLDALFIVER
jgi:anti-sigma B factor antagonist